MSKRCTCLGAVTDIPCNCVDRQVENGAHTPGPWAYRPFEHDDWGIVRMAVRDDTGFHRVICQANYVAHPSDLVEHRQNGTDPAEADARLIAAAPDLLAALMPFVDLKAQTGAHGVISKALDGMAPLTVTVTKAQMLAAWNAVQKARGA